MKKLFAVLMLATVGMGTISSTYALAAPYQTTQHLKKDGTPDKRFKENKAPKAATAAPAAKPAAAAPAAAPKMKKDGTPDKRYKDAKTAAPAKKQ